MKRGLTAEECDLGCAEFAARTDVGDNDAGVGVGVRGKVLANVAMLASEVADEGDVVEDVAQATLKSRVDAVLVAV